MQHTTLRLLSSTWHRALLGLSLAVVTSTASAHVPLLSDGEGLCDGKCTVTSPSGVQLSRHCFEVGFACAEGCGCQNVIGDAHWDPKTKKWVGSFHDCYCVKNGVTEGPKSSCSGYYRWKVHQVKAAAPGDTLRFDLTPGDDAFVQYFDDQDVLPTGRLAMSMLVAESGGGFSGSIEFEDITTDPTQPKRILQVTSFGATTGTAPLFGYLTGMNYIVPDANSALPQATYDTVVGEIEAVDWTQCLLVNDAFPLGLPVQVELSLKNLNGQWYAYGKANGAVPVRLTHEYSPTDDTVTLAVTGIQPSATAVFYYAPACLGDVDRDRDVDQDDYRAVEVKLGRCTEALGCPEDVNLDGYIDDQDLQIVADSIGCSDYGVTALPGCSRSIVMQNPGSVTATADADGTASLVIPLSGLPLSAFYVQAVQLGGCEVSNLARMTLP